MTHRLLYLPKTMKETTKIPFKRVWYYLADFYFDGEYVKLRRATKQQGMQMGEGGSVQIYASKNS